MKEEEDDKSKKPTRPISAYIYFSNHTVPKLKADEGISHKDAMKRAGSIWGELTDEEKKPFNKMHDDDVKRYCKIIPTYYFTFIGMRSNSRS